MKWQPSTLMLTGHELKKKKKNTHSTNSADTDAPLHTLRKANPMPLPNQEAAACCWVRLWTWEWYASKLVLFFLQWNAASHTVLLFRGCLASNSYLGQHSPSHNIILIYSKELFQIKLYIFRNYLSLKKDTLLLHLSCNPVSPKLSSALFVFVLRSSLVPWGENGMLSYKHQWAGSFLKFPGQLLVTWKKPSHINCLWMDNKNFGWIHGWPTYWKSRFPFVLEQKMFLFFV